jgi:hypothetical protein
MKSTLPYRVLDVKNYFDFVELVRELRHKARHPSTMYTVECCPSEVV